MKTEWQPDGGVLFDVDEVPIRLTGRIDRIDRHQSGRYAILDYKTGNSKPLWSGIYNPATGQIVRHVAMASQQTVEQAIQAAQDAFPAWRDNIIVEAIDTRATSNKDDDVIALRAIEDPLGAMDVSSFNVPVSTFSSKRASLRRSPALAAPARRRS